jgi:hypothetical protein
MALNATQNFSTYEVMFDNDSAKRLLFFPYGFSIGIPALFYEFQIEKPLQFGERGYEDVIVHKRGLNIAILDQRSQPKSRIFSSADFKLRMRSIYVVNLKYLLGRKIFFREFNSYFFGISHKLTVAGGDIPTDIDDSEFPMNTFHDVHFEALKYRRSISMADYIHSPMFESFDSQYFIDQMHALHLCYCKVCSYIIFFVFLYLLFSSSCSSSLLVDVVVRCYCYGCLLC